MSLILKRGSFAKGHTSISIPFYYTGGVYTNGKVYWSQNPALALPFQNRRFVELHIYFRDNRVQGPVSRMIRDAKLVDRDDEIAEYVARLIRR